MDVSMSYTFSGNIKDLYDEDNTFTQAVYTCNGCGAMVLDQDKKPHDKFHGALAELFESWVR